MYATLFCKLRLSLNLLICWKFVNQIEFFITTDSCDNLDDFFN